MRGISVEGALFFGKRKGFLIKEEIFRVGTPKESIVHSLRHFREVSTDWKKRIMAKGVKEEDIERELSYPGSKWNQKIKALTTPEDMMDFCLRVLLQAVDNGSHPLWISRWNNDVCYSSHLISKRMKEKLLSTTEPLGTAGLICLAELPKGTPVKKEMRQISAEEPPVEVNVANIEPPTTDNIVVALARKPDGKIRFWTAYPGIIVPKLPRENQCPEELLHNTAFWSNFALIKEKDRKEVIVGSSFLQ